MAASSGRVDDVRRNVLSIMRRLCPEARLPQDLDVWVAVVETGSRPPAEPSAGAGGHW